MSDFVLVGILVVLAIAFIIQAFRRLPSFSFRSDDTGQKKNKETQKTTVVKTSAKASSPVTAEAMSVDDEYRFNFRNARWGMTRDQVKRSDDFTQPKIEDATKIVYKSRFGHMDCEVTFVMNSADELSGGRYDFTTVYEDGARYLSDFETLLELYKERFGEPMLTETVWESRTFEKKKEFHGLAFMEGHFSRNVRWQTTRTAVALFLGNQQGNIDFYIDYACLEPEDDTSFEIAATPEEENVAEPGARATMESKATPETVTRTTPVARPAARANPDAGTGATPEE